ncbi:hypothetical protein F4802DRAFT_567324 [Xylaria palmicola]|nr:hypothetical protein F4802DRAFT_567324 [Xylaria palmicola]
MAEDFTRQYIPAGCLLTSIGRAPTLPPTTAQQAAWQWRFFSRAEDRLPDSLALSTRLQNELLASRALTPFVLLWGWGWIQMAYATQPTPTSLDTPGRVRVYIRPYDFNRSLQGSRAELTKSMSSLLCRLEYSADCWEGRDPYMPQPQPRPQYTPDLSDDSGGSLLAIFNRVPSPDPRPESLSDPDLRWAMNCLLESKVPGLTTTLYPYQGRSAAQMLQRELEPGRSIDPRLRPVLDQAGQAWYHDDVAGLPFKEPRFYERARGGILAEEMGTGKTLICLALILSTKSEPTKAPDPVIAETSSRRNLASLMDMAAAATNKHSIPWKPYFEVCSAQQGYEYENCKRALTRLENQALYKVESPLVEPRRSNRWKSPIPLKKVFLSHVTLIIVPNNLVKQWQNEIKKHTTGLNVLVLVNKEPIPYTLELLYYDVILLSEVRLDRIEKERFAYESLFYCPLEYIQFKRCIIDEGHKLGNGSRSWKNDVMRAIERFEISARWVVTGTPSRGLYGIKPHELMQTIDASQRNPSGNLDSQVVLKQELEDLQRIGNLAAKYLKVRPWANVKNEVGDSVAQWGHYVKANRKDCLINTLNSLIIRHQLTDISTLLPPVDEKITVLDGSYQDRLSLNLFSMMIIFNSVQSQRTDMDYFFHDRQKKSLAQLVKNLRQASFFGGVFFSAEDISNAVETAEGFLERKAVPIPPEDEDIIRQAIEFGKVAVENRLKNVSHRFHSMPIYLQDFPGKRGKYWSLDDEESEEGLVCTDAGLIHSLQSFLNPCIDAPTSLQVIIGNGSLDQQGVAERSQALAAASDADNGVASQTSQTTALAGNTPLGGDYHTQLKSKKLPNSAFNTSKEHSHLGADASNNVEVAGPLARTRIISTVSAKLSYLIDSIIKYKDDEQILVFYDSDNVAFYLASVLDILQIQHLIYSRAGLSSERRAQYVTTFTNSPQFRVLLMDISQAAFGLDMRSASRIYFISPVLNPQVMAQAIGRARRISQQKPVSVETLVLRNSIEEVMIDRREHMTQAEHSRIKSVLDDGKIKEWIRNPRIHAMPDAKEGLEQTALLSSPQYVFGKGFRRTLHPDEGLLTGSPYNKKNTRAYESPHILLKPNGELKRTLSTDQVEATGSETVKGVTVSERPAKRQARVAWSDQEV